MVGQERAIEALSFAVEIDRPGYNMYLMGSTGSYQDEWLNEDGVLEMLD